MLGRALIGFGVAISLMAGLKAIVLWVPPERVALANGWMVMLGALGAVTATTPAETLIEHLGWRGLFWLLALLSAVCALVIYVVVPESCTRPQTQQSPSACTRSTRTPALAVARVKMTIATSCPSGSVGRASTHVEELERGQVVAHLFASHGFDRRRPAAGRAADRLRRRGVSPPTLLAAMAAGAILAQLAIITRASIPAYGAWIVVSAAGAATVLSFASMAALFAKEASGRANAALNLLHVAGAFLIQCLTGFVVALWPEHNGHHPAIAYQTAFAVNLALQVSALSWFLLSSGPSKVPVFLAHAIHRRPALRTYCIAAAASYERAIDASMARIAAARHQAAAWRAAAIASAVLTLALCSSFAQAVATQRMAAVHVVELRHIESEAKPGCGVSADIISTNSPSASADLQSGQLAARGSGLCFR